MQSPWPTLPKSNPSTFGGYALVATLALDLRYAIRRLVARPTFAAIIVVSLALGIGANAVIFSLARALLAGAAPYPDRDRVVVLWFTPPESPGARIPATHGNCAAVRERARSFEHIGCVLPDRAATIAEVPGDAGAAAAPTRVPGQEFTAGVAEALGVPPALGRWFTPAEERGAEPVAVISHALWQRHFAGAPDIIGRRIRATNQSLASEVVTIVGVAAHGFQFFDGRTDYWLPFSVPRGATESAARRLLVVGRLKPGIALYQAQWEVNAIAANLAHETPFTNRGWGIRVEPLQTTLRQAVGRPVLILQGVVIAVLLIACGNVAGLLLAEGSVRRGEIALRAALGAGRWQIARQWLTESVLISALGAALGLAFAWAGLPALTASLPPTIPGANAITLNPSVLAFTATISLLTGFFFGIAPALAASRQDPAHALNRSARAGTAARSRQRLRSLFVIGQLSLAVALCIGTGLMIRSLVRLDAVDIGVDTARLTTFQVQLDGRDYLRETGRSTPSGAAETELTPRLFTSVALIRERVGGVRGVVGATAMAATAPLSGVARRYGFFAAGSDIGRASGQPAITDWFAVLPDYFRTIGVGVLRGRDFDGSDRDGGLPVIVISQAVADEVWRGQDPIGREIQMNLFNDPPRRVVGVVPDVRQSAASGGRLRQVYVPFAQIPPLQSGSVAHGLELFTFVIRFAGSEAPPGQAFREIVSQVDAARPVARMQPLQQYVDDQLGDVRQYVTLLALFGAVAVALAIVGTYGLMAHAVSVRSHEIGIRRALGASRRQVLWLILRRGLGLSAAGVLLGVLGGLIFTNVLESYLWEITPTDPLTFTVVPSLLAAVSLAACYRAARRAMGIDPALVMRQE